MKIWEKFGITEERYNAILMMEEKTIVEVNVSDPVERERILKVFQRNFDVEVVQHLPHEQPLEVFCMKFMSQVRQANDLMAAFLVGCSDHKSYLYQYSDGQIRFCSHDGKGVLKGNLYTLLRRVDDPDNNKTDRRYIKRVLSAMDVYYPLPSGPNREQWEPEPSYCDLMK